MMSSRHVDADVAIVGSGFAGTLTALALRHSGRSVVLIERGRHPRFAIGESTTPLANLLLEELADRYDLPQIRPLSKWGTWQRTRPDLAAGLKRGFTFLHHVPGESFHAASDRSRQLMVAASPNDEVADTHWYRPDVDRMLVEQAVARGVLYVDQTDLDAVRPGPAGVTLSGRCGDQSLVINAGFVVDGSGPRGLLTRTVGSGDAAPSWLPRTQGLYAHFEGVDRWDDLVPSDTIPPYPPDAAALHHVFPGGWIWVLRFANGVTSAGAALTDEVAMKIRASDGEAAWHRLLDTLPDVRAQFRSSWVSHPFVHVPRLSFRTRIVVGEHWALLPSAAGVIDPLLSTGFPLTLLGIARLVLLLDTTVPGTERQAALAAYARDTQAELDVTEQLVAALYAAMDDPDVFTRLCLLYFAAASYTETARRLGRWHLAPDFLLHRHPVFGPELRACAAAAVGRPGEPERTRLLNRIDRAIAPFDVAGLGDRSRRNWYPALASDLIAGAPKLGATKPEIQQLLTRCGLLSAGM